MTLGEAAAASVGPVSLAIFRVECAAMDAVAYAVAGDSDNARDEIFGWTEHPALFPTEDLVRGERP